MYSHATKGTFNKKYNTTREVNNSKQEYTLWIPAGSGRRGRLREGLRQSKCAAILLPKHTARQVDGRKSHTP